MPELSNRHVTRWPCHRAFLLPRHHAPSNSHTTTYLEHHAIIPPYTHSFCTQYTHATSYHNTFVHPKPRHSLPAKSIRPPTWNTHVFVTQYTWHSIEPSHCATWHLRAATVPHWHLPPLHRHRAAVPRPYLHDTSVYFRTPTHLAYFTMHLTPVNHISIPINAVLRDFTILINIAMTTLRRYPKGPWVFL